MNREIGEVFDCNGVKLCVKEDIECCVGCFFYENNISCSSYHGDIGECDCTKRIDSKSVIFEEVEDMEERAIKLTLEKAKEFYNKGGEFKDLALSAFTVEELTHKALPKTWKEYKENWAEREKGIRLEDMSEVELDKIKISKDITSAHNALLALHLLRDCYRQGWKPDYSDGVWKYFPCRDDGGSFTVSCCLCSHFLTFPTKKIAEEFTHNFKDLIIQAGDLL